MNPKFKEGDKVFILSELENYLTDPTASLTPTYYFVTKVAPNPFDVRYTFYQLEGAPVIYQAALVGVHEAPCVLQDIAQRTQARLMRALEGKVMEVLRQTGH